MWKYVLNIFFAVLIGVGGYLFSFFSLFLLAGIASILASSSFEKRKDFWGWVQLLSALLAMLVAIVGMISGIGYPLVFLILAVLLGVSSILEIG